MPINQARWRPVLISYDQEAQTAKICFGKKERELKIIVARPNAETKDLEIVVAGLAAKFETGGKVWPCQTTFRRTAVGSFSYHDHSIEFARVDQKSPTEIIGFLDDYKGDEIGTSPGTGQRRF